MSKMTVFDFDLFIQLNGLQSINRFET
jgi:hypothetical protein